MPQRIGVVLAGGAGRRMGRAKGDLVFEGETLALRAAHALWPVCGSVLISVADRVSNPAPGFPTVVDEPPPGRGPLAGIDAAFGATGTADLVVLACDYPFVDGKLLAALVQAAGREDDLVMPTDPGGRDHPLVALWTRRAAPQVRAAIERGTYKVRGILSGISVRRLGREELSGFDLGRSLANWNRPDDLAGV